MISPSRDRMCHECVIQRPDRSLRRLRWGLGIRRLPANSHVERVTRIELAFSAWEADVLPLNYTRGWSLTLANRLVKEGRASGGRRRRERPDPGVTFT